MLRGDGYSLASPSKIVFAVKALNAGKLVACGERSLTTGWRAPPGTLVAFTPGFLERRPPGSAEYLQACGRPINLEDVQ